MKKFFVAALMTSILAQAASAALIERNISYFHNETGAVIDHLYKINEEEKTGVYYDYETEKRVKVNLEDLSQQVEYPINNVSSGKFVLANINGHIKVCEVYYVFENGMTRFGCQNGKIRDNIGVDRPAVVQFNDHVSNLTAEIKSMNDFKKGDKASLKAFAGNLRVGTKVRIEAIFPNGEAVVQKAGTNLLDTSGILMKFNVEKVQLSDLKKL